MLLLFSDLVSSQVISGLVTDTAGNPIPYVSIGILNGNRGTISDENGSFTINLTGVNTDDTLRFSSLNYFPVDFQVLSLKNKNELDVVLRQRAYLLEGVEVRPLENVEVEFGSTKKYRSGYMFSGIGEGFELARLFSTEVRVFLKEFKFRTKFPDYDSVLFRINIYKSKNGFPGESINKSDIFVTSTGKGWTGIDISASKISVTGEFFISVEAIKGWKDNKVTRANIIISGTLKRGVSYLRLTCLGKWEKTNMELNYYLKAEY